ncbi:DUF1501 domain-containing protein [Engelhardtia mirabilis]|uniref:Sulfatase n=1 Tax=Engelhardtia mirabilis TaxID=2528011 RepID=A0A518BNM3_9BACT|nr:hypothetical protein Pla133_36810 [Planctomycetes bacterium Pla133]QDV02907.1 hypothetical protein Pla86_36790 [Planctomycetes bacterium Pla86]
MDDLRTDRPSLSRRDLLTHGVRAAAGLSLLGALGGAGAFAAPSALRTLPAGSFGRAKRCIFLFMFGGPSQMDLFDYKPELQARDGQTVDIERRVGDVRKSVILGSKRSFRQFGETGQWCSDALPHLSAHMDRLAVIKSLHTDSFAHGSAVLKMNSGEIRQGFPCMGSWVSYGRGSENDQLPGFVVMHDPRGGPISGPANWSSGFIPGEHQGTLLRAAGQPLLDLAPAASNLRRQLPIEAREEQLALLRTLNEWHQASRPARTDLRARQLSYELARAMQDSAREALDLEREDEETLRLYGISEPSQADHPMSLGSAPFGRQCLIARRLMERGVRFVQLYHGGGHQQQTWDAHHGVEENLSIHCPEIDRPIAGLLSDLDRTGLLDETLVVWGGEFGRQPVSQSGGEFQVANALGRDHNPKGFSMWLAGAGVAPGSYGETDELGSEAVVNRHPVRDLHATVLHLMGLRHEQLTYRYGGLDRKLTGVREAHPIEGVLA